MSKFLVLPFSLAWRRFFARNFDVSVEIILLALIFGLIPDKYLGSIKLTEESLNPYIVYMILLPFSLTINAFICNYFGTSFGKYLLGINVEKVGKITLKDWLIRSFRLWRSGLAFGIPILSLWTINKEQKLVNKNEQTTYDKLSGIIVSASKLSKFQIIRAIIIISSLYIFLYWAEFIEMKKNSSIQNTNIAPTYYWQNPITKNDALIDGNWKNESEKNNEGQIIYKFTDSSNYAIVIMGLESVDNLSLNKYNDFFINGVKDAMIFNDGGRYFQNEGFEIWKASGTLKSEKDSLLIVEIRKNRNDFWRIVSVQAPPYNFTQDKVNEIRSALWKTISPNQNLSQ